MTVVVAVVLHKYVVAPLAVNMVDCPEQMVLVPVIVIVGNAFTVTILVDDAEQPAALVPVAVYVLVVPGVTLITAVVALLLHRYVMPPDAVSVVDAPAQMVFVPVIVIVGNALTVTITWSSSEQDPLLPVTV